MKIGFGLCPLSYGLRLPERLRDFAFEIKIIKYLCRRAFKANEFSID
jgi:hypothetical protein